MTLVKYDSTDCTVEPIATEIQLACTRALTHTQNYADWSQINQH